MTTPIIFPGNNFLCVQLLSWFSWCCGDMPWQKKLNVKEFALAHSFRVQSLWQKVREAGGWGNWSHFFTLKMPREVSSCTLESFSMKRDKECHKIVIKAVIQHWAIFVIIMHALYPTMLSYIKEILLGIKREMEVSAIPAKNQQ